MSVLISLHLIGRLLGILALVQGLEFLSLSRATSDRGVWRWKDLSPELGRSLGLFLSGKNFETLNYIRIFVAVSTILYPTPLGVALLFIFHLLTLFRWFGVFNGGSDYMNLLLLWSLSIGIYWPEKLGEVCLWFITFQLSLSYFKAGWIKIKNPLWRNGRALRAFASSSQYQTTKMSGEFAKNRELAKLTSWTLIFFELTFALSIFSPKLALIYIVCGCGLHLLNAYFFGLNRFFFAWVAAYPALYFSALRFNKNF